MRYSLKPKYRRYVQGCGFFSFARNFGDKYGKKIKNTPPSKIFKHFRILLCFLKHIN